eukprot:jgi/Galph1/4088/GphlegSOOS_G2728.1
MVGEQLVRNVKEIIFLGSGTSEGIPRVSCLTETPLSCRTCQDAMRPCSKNRRRNCSILIRVEDSTMEKNKNIVIDVGKFFYESALTWFPKYHLRNIDAVLLTHEHADHMNGLDDLRDFTLHMEDNICPLPVYCDEKTFHRVEASFPYLVNPSKVTGSGVIAKLSLHIINPKESFQVEGVEFIPLPVYHGPNNDALGYRFGAVSYIPDVSEIPPSTLEKIQGSKYLIIDALFPGEQAQHISHFCEPQALQLAKKIQPKHIWLTDFTHRWFHDIDGRRLKELVRNEPYEVNMAYDGLRIHLTS